MHAAYALLVDEFTIPGRSVAEACELVDEAMLPEQNARAAQNRRAFAGLIAGAERSDPGTRQFGVRKRK